jgi:deazaflavin-dependent oxidoreductase (nitroreductase family)
MFKLLRRVLGLATVAFAAIGAVFLVGMRRKSARVQDAVRRLNRAFTNPIVLKTAGAPGATASIVRHVGRTSGRTYETPVGPFGTPDGFLIALPYGTKPDWVKNVRAAGRAQLVHEGTTFEVVEPEVVRIATVLEHLPANEQRLLRMFAVDECLRVRTAGRVEPT